jgi:hypothetical protein
MHLDYRISIGISILVLLFTFAVAGKQEFTYSREADFRKAIARSGADPVRLNADFMIGSHFYLKDGLVVLGRDYMVIFAKSLCEVIDVSNIAHITKECVSQQVQGAVMAIYRLRITMTDGAFLWIGLRDEKETDLMINEFRLLNVPCESVTHKVMK